MENREEVIREVANWIDTNVIAERIVEELEEQGVKLSLNEAKKVWLNVLMCGLVEPIKEAAEVQKR